MNKKPEYSFNKGIQGKLKGFETYLQKLGNGKNTVRQKMNYTGYYLTWLEKENITGASYNDLLIFIDYCKESGKGKKHINSILRAIRNYYGYLKQKDENIINPAANLNIRGIRQKLPQGILPMELLEEIYNTYPVTDARTKRNKTILGIFIYQGITTDELRRIQAEHVKLQKGKIHITGSKKSNGRELVLKPFQILELHEYINQVRPTIITKLTDQLFVSMKGSLEIKNSIYHLFRALKRNWPEVRNAQQIRISVLVHWLKTENLRLVQYKAGHRHISSTERYLLNNIEDMKKQVEKYHPLK